MPSLFDAERSVSVDELLRHSFRRMELRLVAGRGGLGNRILSTRIQKLGLALSGYTGYIKPGRAQFIGGTEIHFLETLDVTARRNAFVNLSSHAICG